MTEKEMFLQMIQRVVKNNTVEGINNIEDFYQIESHKDKEVITLINSSLDEICFIFDPYGDLIWYE